MEIDPWRAVSSAGLPSSQRLQHPTDASKDHQRSSTDGDKNEEDGQYRALLTDLWLTSSTSNSAHLTQILTQFKVKFLNKRSEAQTEPERWKEFLDTKNEDGSTALHSAACFGQRSNCWILLNHGASADIQDGHGWTPLVWASSNGHEDVVKLLLEQGAKPLSESSRKSVDKIELLMRKSSTETEPNSASSFDFDLGLMDINATGRDLPESEGFYKAGFDVGSLEDELLTLGSSFAFGQQSLSTENMEAFSPAEDDISSHVESLNNGFSWDECLPTEMLVFRREQIETLCSALVKELLIPHITRSSMAAKFASSSTLFLAARYAHYFGAPDLMDELFETSVFALRNLLPKKKNDLCFLAYWLTNLSQLVYFLKRDPGLVVSSSEWQGRFAELVQDIDQFIIDDTLSRLDKNLYGAILEYESLPGDVNWDDSLRTLASVPMKSRDDQSEHTASTSWLSRFGFKKSSSRDSLTFLQNSFSSPASTSKQKTSSKTLSPKSVTTTLASIFFVLQQYQTHPSFHTRLLNQSFYHIRAEIMNAFLEMRSRFCSRWKAVQIRLNILALEDWIRNHTVCKNSGNSNQSQRRQSDAKSLSLGLQSATRVILDDVLLPIFIDNPDQLQKHLAPIVLTCQLLQIATNSFGEQISEPLRSFLNTLSSLSSEQQSPDIPFSLDHFPYLNARQLQRLFINYRYEKEESLIASDVIDYLESYLDQQDTLKNLSERSSPSVIGVTPEPNKNNALYFDKSHIFPFSLQFLLQSVRYGGETTQKKNTGSWRDPVEELEERQKTAELERQAREDRIWWEKRVRIEVPDWIISALN